MSRSRRFFDPDGAQSYRGPSDEMLAVDAASELRSLTLLYERYADRLYRYFLLCTGDPGSADRLMRDLIYRLPGELQRFGGQDRTFAGWLFARASEVFWREFSIPSRLYRRVSRFIPSRVRENLESDTGTTPRTQVAGDFAEIAPALLALPPDQREVLGIHFGAELKTAPAAEALRLPASLLSSNVEAAVSSLAAQFNVTSTPRFTEDLSGLMSSQTLSGDNRSGHFALIHGLFYGEVEPELDEPDRKPLMEIGLLIGVVLIGLVGIWIWDLVTPGDPQDPPDEPLSIASDPPARSDPTPTSESEPELTSEPTSEVTLTPESTAVLDADGVCQTAAGRAQFDLFVDRFNMGDFDGLAEMLPGDSGEGSDDRDLDLIHDGVVLDDVAGALEFLQERYDAGERWDVLEAYSAEQYRHWRGTDQLEMYQAWKRENPGRSMIFVSGLDWSGDGAPPEIARGRAVIDCDAGLVVGWDMRAHTLQRFESQHLGSYLDVMEPLDIGESRMVRALVQTDQRPDGGLIHTWEILWWEAIDAEGIALERIDVLSLDGVTVVSYKNDGGQWRLNQRAWIVYGLGDSPPLPDEITLTMPWLHLLPDLITGRGIDPDTEPTASFTEDLTQAAGGSIERFIEVQIENGYLGAVTVRERTRNGERIRPELRILDVARTGTFDSEHFEVPPDPRLSDEPWSEAYYDVPADAWEQLDVLETFNDDDQAQESFRISWNGVAFDLNVQPSRGGLNAARRPRGIDDSATIATAEYRFGTLVWAHRQFSGYPTDAVWDDGRYRFTLELDQETVDSDQEWNLQQLIQLADALSASVTASDNASAAITSGSAHRFAYGSRSIRR